MYKINVIYRTCSQPNRDVKRPEWMDNNGFRPHWFNKEKCYNSILNGLDTYDTIHVLFDGNKQELPKYIIPETLENLECFNGGSDAHSYNFVLDYVKNNFSERDLIYIVEDDYLHLSAWSKALREGAELDYTEYWTLYDHADKYFRECKPCKLYVTYNYHWRTAESTTNTVAFKYQTLMKHWDIHKKFCDFNAGMTWDHAKFLELKEKYNAEVSYPIPGFSTHCDSRVLAPNVDWEHFNKKI
jgi:hypothetical protein